MTLKKFTVTQSAPQQFFDKIKSLIESRDLGKIVSFNLAGKELTLIFSKLGTSQIKYKIEEQNGGFSATFDTEKIAFAHRPFRGDIEEKLARVMQKLGAVIV